MGHFLKGRWKKDCNGERETGFYVKQHLKPSKAKAGENFFPFCGDNVSWHHQQHTALLCNQPQKKNILTPEKRYEYHLKQTLSYCQMSVYKNAKCKDKTLI